MLTFAIITTIFLGVSCITAVIKNFGALDVTDGTSAIICLFACMWSLAWRAFAITSVWMLFSSIGG